MFYFLVDRPKWPEEFFPLSDNGAKIGQMLSDKHPIPLFTVFFDILKVVEKQDIRFS
jgi:hypothetical protein